MGIKTVLHNRTDRTIIIKEGYTGVYRPVATVARGSFDYVWVDEKATFVEYLLTVQTKKEGNKILLTSDDFIECAEITVVDKDDTIQWERTVLRSGVNIPEDEAVEPTAVENNKTKVSFLSKLFKSANGKHGVANSRINGAGVSNSNDVSSRIESARMVETRQLVPTIHRTTDT